MRRSILSICIVLFALVCLIFPDNVSAGSSVSTDTLKVEPSIVQISLTSGQQTASYTVKLTNLTNNPLFIKYSSRDFGALNQTGNVSFYGKGYSPATNPHGLQQSISFSNNGVVIPPDSSQQITVNIINANKLAAGGHFGAALFSPSSIASANSNSNVSLQSSVASLIFLTTASGGTQSIQLLPLKVGDVRFSMPSINYLVFQNNGNTQTSPYGQITLFNPKGQILATKEINTGSGLILPGDSRLFQLDFHNISLSKFTLPGIYKLKIEYKDSGSSQFSTVTKSFLYLNWWVIIPGLVILVLILILLVLVTRIFLKLPIRPKNKLRYSRK